jgi:hypothetical protein
MSWNNAPHVGPTEVVRYMRDGYLASDRAGFPIGKLVNAEIVAGGYLAVYRRCLVRIHHDGPSGINFIDRRDRPLCTPTRLRVAPVVYYVCPDGSLAE